MEPRLASDCSFGCFNAQLSGLPSPGLVFLLPVVVLERVWLPQELTEDLSKLTAAAFRMKMRFKNVYITICGCKQKLKHNAHFSSQFELHDMV